MSLLTESGYSSWIKWPNYVYMLPEIFMHAHIRAAEVTLNAIHTAPAN